MKPLASVARVVESPRRRGALVLFALAFVYCLLTANGVPVFDGAVRRSSSYWLWAGIDPGYGLPAGTFAYAVPGTGGTPHFLYSVGQQLLYVPFDVVLCNVLPDLGLQSYGLRDWVGTILAMATTTSLATVMLFLLLGETGSSVRVSFWAALLGLICSTMATQTSLGLEAGEEVMYLAGGLLFAARQARAPGLANVAGLVVCSAMAPLLRLPHLAYLPAFGLMGFLATGGLPASVAEATARARRVLTSVWVPVAAGLVVALMIDRAYHFARFGEWTTNYIAMQEELVRRYSPDIEEGFFFGFPWQTGVLLQLFGPSKSLFVYYPLLTVSLLALGAIWKKRRDEGPTRLMDVFSRPQQWVLAAVLLVFLPQFFFYANYRFTGSLGHWGNRFIEAPVTVFAVVFAAAALGQFALLGRLARVLWVAGLAVCFATTILSTYLRPGVDLQGYKMFEVVSLEQRHMHNQLSFLHEHPYTFHLGRRALMVSYALTGQPKLANAERLKPVAWEPNYWPFSIRRTPWGARLPEGVLGALPWVWGALWLVWATAVGLVARRWPPNTEQ